MDACKVCGAAKPRNPWVIGFVYNERNRIAGVAYNCPCGTTRTIPLDQATTEEKDRGMLATGSAVRAAG